MMLRLLCIGIVWLVAACGAAETPSAQVLTPEVTEIVPTVAPTLTTTGAPTAEPTIEQPVTLNIWFPEQLAPLDNEDAADLLSEQISAFQTANANVEVSFRLKSTADAGGIMSTLRSANAVAPGAVPDLTLMRRADLIMAVQLGLIEPITEARAAAVLGGASLFGGIGSALGAVVGATLLQTVKSGLVLTGVNLYLQPIVMAGIIFLAVLIDSLRARRLRQQKRRTIRPIEA